MLSSRYDRTIGIQSTNYEKTTSIYDYIAWHWIKSQIICHSELISYCITSCCSRAATRSSAARFAWRASSCRTTIHKQHNYTTYDTDNVFNDIVFNHFWNLPDKMCEQIPTVGTNQPWSPSELWKYSYTKCSYELNYVSHCSQQIASTLLLSNLMTK